MLRKMISFDRFFFFFFLFAKQCVSNNVQSGSGTLSVISMKMHYPLDEFDFRALPKQQGGISVYELAGQRRREQQRRLGINLQR